MLEKGRKTEVIYSKIAIIILFLDFAPVMITRFAAADL
jgi:hypothetical protein